MYKPGLFFQTSSGGFRHACLVLPDERLTDVCCLRSGKNTLPSVGTGGEKQGLAARLGVGRSLDRPDDVRAKGLGDRFGA